MEALIRLGEALRPIAKRMEKEGKMHIVDGKLQAIKPENSEKFGKA